MGAGLRRREQLVGRNRPGTKRRRNPLRIGKGIPHSDASVPFSRSYFTGHILPVIEFIPTPLPTEGCLLRLTVPDPISYSCGSMAFHNRMNGHNRNMKVFMAEFSGTYPGPQIARNFEPVPEYAARPACF